MNLGVCIGLNIITLCAVTYCLKLVISSKKWIGVICMIWIGCFNAPLMSWSLCAYLYALFDSPSLMLVLLCLYYLARFWLGKEGLAFLQQPFFSQSVRYVWIVLGAFLYFGALGFVGFDIYHLEFKITIFILCAISLLCYALCRLAGFAMIVCMIAYKAQILGDMSIWSYYICPFLWVWCMVVALWQSVYCGFCKDRNGKKVA